MYLRQLTVSLVVGLLILFAALTSGFGPIAALAVGGLAVIGLRVGWATIGRSRYWLSRNTKSTYKSRCPNCNRYRYRIAGDWILTCKRCGWKVGWPVARWVTKSVPAIQFQRSVSKPEAFAAGVFVTIFLYARPASISGPAISFTLPALTFPFTLENIVAGLLGLVMFVAIMTIALVPRRKYCKDCGQDLGRRPEEDHCPRCGCNRFTTQDPGVDNNNVFLMK